MDPTANILGLQQRYVQQLFPNHSRVLGRGSTANILSPQANEESVHLGNTEQKKRNASHSWRWMHR